MTNTTKKMTKRDYFTAIRNLSEVQSNPDLVSFIDHELELLAKKNSADKKLTPVQQENLGIQERILEFMELDHLYTVTDLMKGIPECGAMSNQRVTAIVRIMREDGRVERIEEKRKAYFRKAIKVEG